VNATARAWSSVPLKRLFRVVNGSTPSSGESAYWDGEIPWVTPEDLGALKGPLINGTRRTLTSEGYHSCGTTLVPPGSILLSTRAPIGHLAIAAVDICTNQGCKSLAPRRTLTSRYFYYSLLASRADLQALGQGATFQELSTDKLASFAVRVPPDDMQREVAAFLDRKTAAIDALIAKKERLIELLQEKRQALITHAVTRGLNPSVPMKDSGVDWIGRIPAHWQVNRLKHLTPQVTVGIVVTPSKYYVDDGVPCPRSFNVRERMIDKADLAFISAESNQLHAKSILRKGDLVAVRTGQPGTTAMVDDFFDGANCIDLIVVRQSRHFESRFVCAFMNSSLAHRQYEEGSEGALQQHFNVETAKNLLLPVPPVGEQDELARYLDAVNSHSERLQSAVQKHIERLREYRQALITTAVTGKIDVTNEVSS